MRWTGTRREWMSLLGVASLASKPEVSRSAPTAQAPKASDGFDPWVEVSAANVKHNVTQIRERVSSRPIVAVIKNNGYGMGIAEIGQALEHESAIHTLAVVKLDEAHRLRDAKLRKPILCMGPFSARELEDAVARDIMPMVYSDWQAEFAQLANKLQRAIPVHLCLDTGMGRVGVPFDEAAPLTQAMAGSNSIEMRGVMTTLSEDPELDREQVRRLRDFHEERRSEGIELGPRHAASSFALFEQEDAFLDAVRPGMAIFGVYSEQRFRESPPMELRPSLALRCRVAYVKRLQPGESAGYNRAYRAENNVWVATLPIGHVDGLPRAAAQGGKVTIAGKRYPIVASISASHTIVELGDTTDVQPGDIATVFDWTDGSRVEDFAAGFSGSVYDLMMHLNPLLPRHPASA